ncbi:MAG: hypothetical protein R3C11_16755 [Planctomycetaceae bacterium]
MTILLNEILAWVRANREHQVCGHCFTWMKSLVTSPMADHLPKPMLTLLKQARAYGLGVVLATQNPVDLDYKGLSNTGTWFLGRLRPSGIKSGAGRTQKGLRTRLVMSLIARKWNRPWLD